MEYETLSSYGIIARRSKTHVSLVKHFLLLLSLDDSSSSHSSSNAHGYHTNLLSLSLQFREKRGNLTGPSATKRMTQGNCSAFGIHFLERNVELLNRIDGLRCKGLVDLVNVHVFNGNSDFAQDFGDGVCGAFFSFRC